MPRRVVGYLLIIAGLLFCLVPLAANEYEAVANQRRLHAFVDEMERIEPAEQAVQRREAEAFNTSLVQTGEGTRDPFDTEVDLGPSEVNTRSDAYGFLVIPKINVNLPIYLGASKEHLGIGLGQIEGTSLPVGGVGSRSVIAGHRGGYTNHFLLFVDQLVPGDRIYLVVQGELLIYEMYATEVIDPTEWEKLAAIEGQDTLTLLTCTPPPVNSHRLLVDARRVEPAPPSDGGVGEAAASPAERLRAELRAAESSATVSTPLQAVQWVTRAAIVVLALALVWVIVLLVRAVRERGAGLSVTSRCPVTRA